MDHTRRFGYDGQQMLVQFDREGVGRVTAQDQSHRYLWGPAVDQILADEQLFPPGPGEYPGSSFSSPWVESGTSSFPLPPGEGQGEGAAHGGGYDLSTPGRVLWPLADHLGTVRDLAQYDAESAMTAVVDHRQYGSFGNLVSAVAPATNQPAAVDFLFGFTGRPFDKTTGLQNNLNRWYDPAVGRWLSPDPLGLAAGDTNPYRYCDNVPVAGKDPNGLEDWQLHLSGHGGPHIQLGNHRWSAVTLEPIRHGNDIPPRLTEAQLRELAKKGILQRIAKNVPESIIRAAAEEVAKEAARKGGKAAIKQLAKAVLRRMPVVLIIFAGADYAEGGWEKAAKNAVVPGDLIEAVAAEAGDLYDQWFAEEKGRLYEKRFWLIRGWLPEVP